MFLVCSLPEDAQVCFQSALMPEVNHAAEFQVCFPAGSNLQDAACCIEQPLLSVIQDGSKYFYKILRFCVELPREQHVVPHNNDHENDCHDIQLAEEAEVANAIPAEKELMELITFYLIFSLGCKKLKLDVEAEALDAAQPRRLPGTQL